MAKVEEWAIRDEATGKYAQLDCQGDFVWADLSNYIFRDTYIRACSQIAAGPEWFRSARIVPAPPREMTDGEAWAWFLNGAPCRLAITAGAHDGYVIRRVRDINRYQDVLEGSPIAAAGLRAEDAIRAARKVIEGS